MIKRIKNFFKEEYIILYYPDEKIYSVKYKSWYEDDYLYLFYTDFTNLEAAQKRLEDHLKSIKKVKKTKPELVYKIKV